MTLHSSNLFSDIPEVLSDELVEQLCSSEHVRIERIVSRGHASPPGFWYDQSESEWVVVLKGSGVLDFVDPVERIELTVGDSILIHPHRKHRLSSTSKTEDTIWLAVFFRESKLV